MDRWIAADENQGDEKNYKYEKKTVLRTVLRTYWIKETSSLLKNIRAQILPLTGAGCRTYMPES